MIEVTESEISDLIRRTIHQAMYIGELRCMGQSDWHEYLEKQVLIIEKEFYQNKACRSSSMDRWNL